MNLSLSGTGTKTFPASTINIAGDLTSAGTATIAGASSTLNFNGTNQNITGTATLSVGNVQLSGIGTKTIGTNATISSGFSVGTGAIANFSNSNTYTANTITLGGGSQAMGTYGSTASLPAATYQTNGFFAGNGLITIANGTARTYYSIASGDWATSATWSTLGFGYTENFGSSPVAGDGVVIGNNAAVTLTGGQACSTLNFSNGTTATSSLDMSAGSLTLASTGAITMNRPTSAAGNNLLVVGSGTLTAVSLDYVDGGGAGSNQLSISTGSASFSGNVSSNSVNTFNSIQITGAGQLSLGGALFNFLTGTLSAASGSTVTYSGAVAQSVQPHAYHHLALTGAGAKSATAGTTDVNGNLTIADNTSYSVGNATLNVYGTTTVGTGTGGALNFITSTSGGKVFGGMVTINSNATWNNAIDEGFIFNGGITNLGTFTSGNGTYQFTTNAQSITGITSIPVLTVQSGSNVNVTVNGTFSTNTLTISGATNSIINNGTVTINTVVSGSGRITQSAGATLNVLGTASLTGGITATALGNTVNYSGGAQTVITGNYYHLNLSGSGLKTLQTGTTSIAGNFEMSGTSSANGVAGITFAGNVIIGASATFSPSSYTHLVTGDWTSNGTLTGAGSTINFNGANQSINNSATSSFYDVVFSGSGTKTFNSSIDADGNFTINSGVVVDLGTFTTHTAGTLTIAGVSQLAGTYGSDTPDPDPDYVDNTFFAASNGILTVEALVFYSRATGNWNDPNTWSTSTYGGPAGTLTPGSSDVVRLGGGNFTITATTNSGCTTLSFLQAPSGTQQCSLVIDPGIIVTVSGNVTIPRNVSNVANNVNSINVGSGTLNAGNIAFTNGFTSTSGANVRHRIDVSTGTLIVNGNVTGSGITSTIAFSGSGLFQLYGTLYTASNGTLTTVSTTTMQYMGGNQTIGDHTYNGHVIISGTGAKTWALGANRTIGGNFTINTGNTVSLTNTRTFGVAGTTDVFGSLSLATSTKTFTGDVTIYANGGWTETNAASSFAGSFVYNGSTFSVGTGVHTFSGASKTIGGNPISIPNISITGSYTNTGNVTVSTALSGSGSFTVGAGTTVNVGGSLTIATLDATGAGNTINYNGTGAQTVVVPVGGIYQNLSFNNTTGSGIATLSPASSTIYVQGNWSNNGASTIGGFRGFNPNGGVVIFNGAANQNINGSAPSSFYRLVSNSGTSVTLLTNATVSNALDLLSGNFINSAVLTLGNGSTITRDASAVFTGSAPLSGTPPLGASYNLIYTGTGNISTGLEAQGLHVKDFTVNLSGTLTQANAMNLYGILQVSSGATYDPGVSLLTVKSFSDLGTDAGGSIAAIQGTFVSNPVYVERYFRARDNKDRFISSPVANATVAQLQAAFPVTGSFTGSSFPCTGCLNDGPSLKWYKESTTGVLTRGYQGYPTTNNSATLAAGVGYDAYMWNGVAPTTITFSGNINQGNISNLGTNGPTAQVVSKTVVGAGTPSADGWNLIGNPYPSPIRWTGSSTGGWTLTNIDAQAWAYDVFNGVWVAINPGSDIAIGQAFWVQVNTVGNGTGTINITEGAKSPARSGVYYRQRQDEISLKVNLSRNEVTESAFLVLNEGASVQYQKDKDFSKIELGIESMHMTLIKENYHLGFYALNERWSEDIPVRIVAEEEGLYELSFEQTGNFSALTDYYLVDVVNQERMAFSPNMKYSFLYSKKHPEERFVLTRKTDLPIGVDRLVQAYPNPTSGKLSIVINGTEKVRDIVLISSSGEILNAHTKQESGSLELTLDDYPSGVYLVKVMLDSGVIVKRVIKY